VYGASIWIEFLSGYGFVAWSARLLDQWDAVLVCSCLYPDLERFERYRAVRGRVCVHISISVNINPNLTDYTPFSVTMHVDGAE
jgi:hypothetical protein